MASLELILLQIIAHLLSDYFFQTDTGAKDKNENGFKSKFLAKHIAITFLCSWVLSLDVNFVCCALGISASHLLIDGFKKHLNKNSLLKKYSFFIDQAVHLGFLFLFVWLFEKYFEPHRLIVFDMPDKWLFTIVCYLLCAKPVNILIREIIIFSKIEAITSTDDELKNAGKLIGSLERLLVITLVLLTQYEAIGFLIAAKSILRYKDSSTLKTEYVLIGTMLSFAIALVLGIAIKKFDVLAQIALFHLA